MCFQYDLEEVDTQFPFVEHCVRGYFQRRLLTLQYRGIYLLYLEACQGEDFHHLE